MLSNDHRGSLYAGISGFLYGFVGYFGVKVGQKIPCRHEVLEQ